MKKVRTEKDYLKGLIFGFLASGALWLNGICMTVGSSVESEVGSTVLGVLALICIPLWVVVTVLAYYFGGGFKSSFQKFWSFSIKFAHLGGKATGCLGVIMGIPLIGFLLVFMVGYIILPWMVMSIWIILIIFMPWAFVLMEYFKYKKEKSQE